MYIKKVTINNYRSFRSFEAQLQKLTVVIGENDTGKTNFFTALSLPLSGNQIDFNQKRLSPVLSPPHKMTHWRSGSKAKKTRIGFPLSARVALLNY